MILWLLGGAAFLVTCASAPLVRRRLIRHDILDRPNERSSHQIPTPRGGGIACALGLATAALAATFTSQPVPWHVLGAALVIGIVGFLDDRFQLSPVPRLVAQLLVGAALGAAIGGAIWSLIGMLLVPLIVNVVNFMDGINGITGLTMMLWGGTAIFAGLAYGSSELALLGALTLGTASGFLPWNIPSARLFLGDVGSYLFGALAAGGIILGSANGVPAAILLAPLSVYLLDVGIALVRRVIQRAPLFQAHRDHVYQQLVDQGRLPHIVVALWTTLISTAAVIVWNVLDWRVASIATTALVIIYLSSTLLWQKNKRVARLSRRQEETA